MATFTSGGEEFNEKTDKAYLIIAKLTIRFPVSTLRMLASTDKLGFIYFRVVVAKNNCK